MDRRVFVAVGGLGAAAIVTGLFFLSDDEEEIREVCGRLAAAVTFPEQRGNPAFFALELRARISEELAPNATFSIPEAGGESLTIQEVVGGAMSLGDRYKSAKVDLADLTLVTRTKTSATVRARAIVSAVGLDGGPRREERSVTIDLSKHDGDWKVARVEARRASE